MITFFPMPYSDELLYSTIARYHILSGNTLYCQTAEDLFGFRRARSSVVMPLRMGLLGKRTAPFGISMDDLIGHTLYPYYTAFQTESLCQEINALQIKNESVSISAKMGAVGDTNIIPKHLRFCPQCYAEAQRRHGEGYWSRLHQTPGVLVCDQHGCLLLETQVPYYDSKTNVYETASPSVIFPAICQSPLSPLGLQQAENIAADIRYLYGHYKQIRTAFAKHNYTCSKLLIILLQKKGLATECGHIRLNSFLSQFYAFFDADLMARLGLSCDPTSKRPWMVSMCRHTKKSFHPIRYILMARFLCNGLPYLIRFAEETSIESLILPKPEYGYVEEMEVKLERYRAKWLEASNSMPGAGRNEIRKMVEATYTWLLRHDKDWLMEHCNEKRPTGGNKTFADRTKQDLIYSGKVHAAADALRCAPGKPVWITKTRLAKQIDLLPRLLPELPLTQKAFDQEVESQMDFRLRKIAWAERELASQGKPAAKWQILKLAAIRDCDWDRCWIEYITMNNRAREEEYYEATIS